MQDIIIFGAGGFGREVQWLIERINQVEHQWNILGYIDDRKSKGDTINGHKILGGMDTLAEYCGKAAITCSVGNSAARKKIINQIEQTWDFDFPNLIDPSVIRSGLIDMGKGNIICAANILTVNIKIEDFVIINLDCTVGHDAQIQSFTTINPSVNVSGGVMVEESVELGTGSQIIQGKKIGRNTIVGAGAVVVKDLPENCTAIGAPAKPVKYFNS